MEQEKMKKFRIKCCLREIETHKPSKVQEIIVEGYYGNHAVTRLMDQLAKEGKYYLDLDQHYSYIQID